MTTSEVLFASDGPLAFLTFNRPDARNAMTWAMYDALARACDEVEANDEIRVFILRGAGDAFVAGTDIRQFTEFATGDDGIAYERRMEAVIDRLERLRRPTIAQVHGVAAGGGCVIALTCDLRVCTPAARFGVPIARTLGNCLSAANLARLVDLIGPARTKDLLFTGRLIDAREAEALGLVNRMADPAQIDTVVRELALAIAANAPLTIRITKEAVRRVARSRRPAAGEDDDLIGSCYASSDFHEGVSAFLEKRTPSLLRTLNYDLLRSRPAYMNLAVISVCALALAVIVSCVSRVNVGVLAIALAWIVGVYMGDMPVNTVMAGFPSQLCLTLIGVTLLFALAETNGTLGRITDHAVRLCRGNCGTIPIMFFGLGALFSSAGPGNIATGALLAPIAMATAVRTGIPLFLMAIMVGNGANSGALSPFAPTGIIVNGLMARNGLPGLEWRTFIYNFGAHVLVAFAGYALLGGLKLFSAGRADVDEVTRWPADYVPTPSLDDDGRHCVRHARRRFRQGERRNVRISRRGDPGAVRIGRRWGGVQADAVAGDRDGVRGHCADSARRAHTGDRSARVARHSHLFCTNRHGGHRFSHGGRVRVQQHVRGRTSGLSAVGTRPGDPVAGCERGRDRGSDERRRSPRRSVAAIDARRALPGRRSIRGEPRALQQTARLGPLDGSRRRNPLLPDLLIPNP